MNSNPSPIGLLLAQNPATSVPAVDRLRRAAIAEVMSALGSAKTFADAAKALGVTYRSLRRWLVRYSELRNKGVG